MVVNKVDKVGLIHLQVNFKPRLPGELLNEQLRAEDPVVIRSEQSKSFLYMVDPLVFVYLQLKRMNFFFFLLNARCQNRDLRLHRVHLVPLRVAVAAEVVLDVVSGGRGVRVRVPQGDQD